LRESDVRTELALSTKAEDRGNVGVEFGDD
jgi:hypothetical protein